MKKCSSEMHQFELTDPVYSKANACNIGTLFKILSLEHMEKNTKHLPIDSISHSHNSAHVH